MKKFYLLLLLMVIVLSCNTREYRLPSEPVMTVALEETNLVEPSGCSVTVMYENGYIGNVTDYKDVRSIASTYYIVADQGSTISGDQDVYLWGIYKSSLPEDYLNKEIIGKDTIYSYGQFYKVELVKGCPHELRDNNLE